MDFEGPGMDETTDEICILKMNCDMDNMSCRQPAEADGQDATLPLLTSSGWQDWASKEAEKPANLDPAGIGAFVNRMCIYC